MKRVLIITYNWPPYGGERIHRWLKFCKYLPSSDWQPVVFTVEHPDIAATDPSLLKDVDPQLQVIKVPSGSGGLIVDLVTRIWGGFERAELAADDASEESQPLGDRLAAWVKANLLIPDGAAPWIEPSVEFLQEFLVHEPVDAIISAGPPNSSHLIAQQVKEFIKQPWIADFDDPWTDRVFHLGLPLADRTKNRHKDLEQSVVDDADLIVLSSRGRSSRLAILGGDKVETITNGFDPEDITSGRILAAGKFRITYAGNLTADRNHQVLWEALRAVSRGLVGFKKSLEIDLLGDPDPEVIEMAGNYGFSENLVRTGALPHAEALNRMAGAHVLLFTMQRTHRGTRFLSPRLFQYLGCRRPILMIGPLQSDAAHIIKDARSGEVVGYEDFHNTKTVLSKWFEAFKNRDLSIDPQDLDQYSVKTLARRLGELLDGARGSAEGSAKGSGKGGAEGSAKGGAEGSE